jgi:hypothetical protein
VAKHNIEMVGPESMEAYIDALRDTFGTEVEMCQIISPKFSAERVGIARNIPESDTQEDFAHSTSVKRGGINEI